MKSPLYYAGKAASELRRIAGMAAREVLRASTPIVPGRVLFHTQEMRYCCNPRYIYEALERMQRESPESDRLDIVWRLPEGADPSVESERGGVPMEVRGVPANSWEYFRMLFSASVVITNSSLYLSVPVRLKKGQRLIQTWHGSLGIKRHGEQYIKDTWRRARALKATARMTDYCISNSTLEDHSFRDTYWPRTPILEYGHARNDLFFPQYEEKRRQLRRSIFGILGIPAGRRVVMYAPTFRDRDSLSRYNIDFRRLVDALTKRFPPSGAEDTWCVILRYHPSLAKSTDGAAEIERWRARSVEIVDATPLPDMQELIAVTDVAITDYSSWIYDYMLMRGPGFIYATDLEDYDQERGFYYPITETPFAIATDNDQLEAAILSFDEEAYSARLEQFLRDKGCIEDGHAAERAAVLINDLIHGKEPSGPYAE